MLGRCPFAAGLCGLAGRRPSSPVHGRRNCYLGCHLPTIELSDAPLRLTFASSSTLARQVGQGAPANLFASADQQWMDHLAQRGLVAADTRRDLLANSLVLVMSKDQAPQVTIGPGLDRAALLCPSGRIAAGDPAHVPVGI